jgi:hypothetical protein
MRRATAIELQTLHDQLHRLQPLAELIVISMANTRSTNLENLRGLEFAQID